MACGAFAPDPLGPGELPAGEDARSAVLVDPSGGVAGVVTFTAVEEGVLVEAEVFGLVPAAFHGFHLHQGPTCTDPDGRIDFTAAGPHWNPEDDPHGDHAGDMPVLWASDLGIAATAFVTDRVTLDDLAGRAVMVHGLADNYGNVPDRYSSSAADAPPSGADAETLATGDAGDRIACGLVDGTALRLSGPNRFATAIAISQATFGDGAASAAVVARADPFADGLAGTPLAADRGGPLLLSTTEALDDATAAELGRVLPDGATVYLLGGEEALSTDVEEAVAELGFAVERIAGPTRVETAIAIARELGDPELLLVTTGFRFPDALTAGAAAAGTGGAVLLTIGEQRHPSVDAYLAERGDDVDLYAVGGPAARPYPEAEAVVGRDRIATAVAVAERFASVPLAVGVARQGGVGDDTDTAFADALTGGAHAAAIGGPVLLTPTGGLAPQPAAYVADRAGDLLLAYLYGGTSALAPQVHADLQAALHP